MDGGWVPGRCLARMEACASSASRHARPAAAPPCRPCHQRQRPAAPQPAPAPRWGWTAPAARASASQSEGRCGSRGGGRAGQGQTRRSLIPVPGQGSPVQAAWTDGEAAHTLPNDPGVLHAGSPCWRLWPHTARPRMHPPHHPAAAPIDGVHSGHRLLVCLPVHCRPCGSSRRLAVLQRHAGRRAGWGEGGPARASAAPQAAAAPLAAAGSGLAPAGCRRSLPISWLAVELPRACRSLWRPPNSRRLGA